ncbi:hypothetical protein A3Q56_04222 [Intoshia linei]|uniref:UDP-N-acetylglucosamine diphosphorylase n=1 Tax=Intoshia linei TaxID=1819745 RepID=A0A177B183_9BILA|nr:hypothetical protein A3Q56_04222 [Intoshia linei]
MELNKQTESLQQKQPKLSSYLYSNKNDTKLDKLRNECIHFNNLIYGMDDVCTLLNRYTNVDSSKQEKDSIEPIPKSMICNRSKLNEKKLVQYQNIAYESITNGHMALMVMAGGMGSRLGFNKPKGVVDIGLPSKMSLFELLSLKLVKLVNLAKNNQICEYGHISLLIMTSHKTHFETICHFENNHYFGLDKNYVHFFQQTSLPAISRNGEFVLMDQDSLKMIPNGNGGILDLVHDNLFMTCIKNNNIKHFHVVGIDNLLSLPCDPAFMGYCIQNQFDAATKATKKMDVNEKIGMFVLETRKVKVLEYSESINELNSMSGDELVFNCGNICNHYFSIKCFNTTYNLPYHVAIKRGNFFNVAKKENSLGEWLQLEKFIFDIFPFIEASKIGIWMVDRRDEFAPIKNGNDIKSDCPYTARNMMNILHRKWLNNAKAEIVTSKDIEIFPQVSYEGEGLEIYRNVKINDE